MKSFWSLLILLVLLAPAPAFAGLHMHGVSGSGPSCAQPTDNGCAASQTYITNASYQDTNLAYDMAQTGQCTPCTGTTLTNRISALHAIVGNSNVPGWDYPVGSAPRATLRPINLWNTDHPGSPCTYHYPGDGSGIVSAFGGGPVLQCFASQATATSVTIQGYDFSAAGADGTNCAQIEFKDNGSFTQGTAFTLINDYFLSQGSCFSNSASVSGVIPGFLYYPKSIGNAGATYSFYNVTADGNFANAPDSAHGVRMFFFDNRHDIGTGTGGLIGKQAMYSTFVNLGHDPFIGATGAGTYVQYSVVGNDCLGGNTACHGEVEEDISPLSYRDVNMSGNLVFMGSNYVSDPLYPLALDWTTAFYISNGKENGGKYGTVTLNNNLVLENNQQCTNTGPYSPAHPCTGGADIFGVALFSIQNPPFVNVMHVHNNGVDSTGSTGACYKNFASEFTTMVGSTSGTTLNITRPDNSYGFSWASDFADTLWPGLVIYDTNAADGFVTTSIASYDTYSNQTTFTGNVASASMTTAAGVTLASGNLITTPTIYGQPVTFASASISGGSAGSWTLTGNSLNTGSQTIIGFNNTTGCNPTYNPGCGTLTLANSQPSITVTGTFQTQAGILTPDFGADNYTIGGTGNPSARLLTFGSLPWSGVTGNGAVACP